jgi:hypothetical protein
VRPGHEDPDVDAPRDRVDQHLEPVAELALTLALAGLRGLGTYVRATAWGEPIGRNLQGARVTVLGGGAILTETVFDLQGVGQYTAEAIGQLDVPPVLAVTMFSAFFIVLLNAIVDILSRSDRATERNVIGNIVGTYNDLAELMALAAQGKVTLHTKPYPLEAANDAFDDLDNGRLPGTRAILIPS